HETAQIAEAPETRRYRLCEAVTRMLAVAAREAPTVLILDDLQWVDSATALLLAYVLRDVDTLRCRVGGPVRGGGGERLPAPLEPLVREAVSERLALGGL